MKKIYFIVLLFLLACGVSYAGPIGGPPLPSTGLKTYTVAAIPSASANPNMAIIVTDGNTDTDCETTGGGSTRNICISDGTNWVVSGDGAPGSVVSDTVFGDGSTWDGVTAVAPSKNAVRDQLYLYDTDGDGDIDNVDGAVGGGDITGVGPGATAAGDALTDGYQTSGTTMLIWEGTTVDTNELSIIVPADPGADIDLTLPTATATISGIGLEEEFSGVKTFSALPIFSVGVDINEDVDIDFDAADEEVSIVNSAEYGADGAQVTIENTDADVGAAMYLLRLRYTDDGQANADFAVFEDNNGDDMIAFTDGGAITAAGNVTAANLLIGDAANIGSASDTDAIAIAANGVVTFTQNVIIPDTGNIGSASDTDAIAIAANGETTFSQEIQASGGIDASAGTTILGTISGTLSDGTASWNASTQALAGFSSLGLTGDLTIAAADPDIVLDDTDGADGFVQVAANDADDAVVTIGVDDSVGDDQTYIELDGVNETVDVLKAATFSGTVGVTGVITATAAGANITLADGQLIDLSGVTPSDATDEGLIIPTWVDVTPTTDTPFITYDPASNAIKVYEGGWVSISGGSGAPVDAKYVVWDALNGTLSGEMLLAGGAGVDLTGSGPGYAANGTLTLSFDSTEVDATTWSDGSNASNVWTFDVSGTNHTMTAGDGLMTFGDAVTVTDTLTASNGIALGTSKAITGTTGITFGGVGATTTISSSDWTIDATGVMANMGNITSDGTIEGVTLTEGGEAVYNATETPGGELGGTWASPTIDDSVTVATWTFTGTTTVADIDGSGTISANLFTPDAADGADIGSTTLEFSDVYLADGSIIYGQNDQSNTLTSSATGWEFALDIGFPDGYGIDFGTGDDWSGIWNNTNLAVEFTTALTASTAVGTPMFKIQTDSGTAGMTADQDIFSIYKGSTELFTVDEDGDIWYAGVLSAQATDDAYLGLLQATASDTDWWIGIQGDGQGDDDDPLEFRKSETKDTSVQMELDADGDLHLTGDLYVTGDDIFMNTNTDTAILVADGTNFNVVVPSGDVSITNAGVTTVTDLTISSEAQYDLLTRGAASWERLAIGSEGEVLKVVSGAAAWGTVSATAGGDANDVQYNSGGLAGEDAFEYVPATNTLQLLQNGTDPTIETGDDTYSWGHTPMVGIEGALEVDGVTYTDGGLTTAGTITLQNSETITNATNTQVKIAADSGEAIIYDLDTATDQQVEILTDSGVTQLLLNSAIALQFRDTGLYINSNDDGHLDLTADTSIDLNGAVVATSSVSVTGGALTGPISTSSTPGSVANFYGAFVVSSNADIDLTLPSAVDGMSVCFGQGADRTDALTVTAASSDVIVLEGVAGTTEAGGGESTLTSGGAATDRMCLVAVGTTNWYANKVGTWSE